MIRFILSVVASTMALFLWSGATQFLPWGIDRISTYSTESTFSWIVTQSLTTDYSGYFLREVLTQLLVAMLLVLFLSRSCSWSPVRRLGWVALGAIAASVACYGQLMNWWAVPLPYGLGVSFNLLVGWTLAALPPIVMLRSHH